MLNKPDNQIFCEILLIVKCYNWSCTVWSPVTDHYVNKVNFFSVYSKCQDCFYVADKGIISSND